MSDGDRYSEENLSRALGLQSTSSVGEEAVLYRMVRERAMQRSGGKAL